MMHLTNEVRSYSIKRSGPSTRVHNKQKQKQKQISVEKVHLFLQYFNVQNEA